MPLDKLGPYKLDRVLGRGGMGAVYAGLNEQTGEWAALKVLSAAVADDPAFRDRFKIEIETLKKLRHPNIVQLHGFGEETGHLFYVMELVVGRSLQDDLAKRRRFTWQEVTRIGILVARALKHAHDRGIVHRDLKPANLLVDNSENIKLTDFGIAKLFGASHLTMEGGIIGTADYMAPEQADGKGATNRSDLYSLGNVLYALLTGKPPFSGKSVTAVLQGLRNEKPIAVHRLCPDVPEELDNIVMQLLEKDPQKRIPTAIALANRLQAMEHALTQTRPTAPDDGVIQFPREENVGHRSKATQADSESMPTAELSVAQEGVFPTPTSAENMTQISDAAERRTGATLAEAVTSVHLSVASPHSSADVDSVPVRSTHFTTVTEAELRRAGAVVAPDEEGWTKWLKTGLLAIALLLAAAMVWQGVQPATADAIHRRIEEAASGGDIQKLLTVEGDIQQFLSRFAEDSRAAGLAAYQEEIDLYRLQKQFELKARRLGLADSLLPVERAYLEALRLAANDPELALRRFQSVVQVFEGTTAEGMETEQTRAIVRCVELARQQVARLQDRVAEATNEQRSFLRQRLAEVERLTTEDPPRATAILAGIIELYQERAWAAEYVTQAKELQQQLSAANK